jgi:uncharacterized protein YcbK (DUF882 family)
MESEWDSPSVISLSVFPPRSSNLAPRRAAFLFFASKILPRQLVWKGLSLAALLMVATAARARGPRMHGRTSHHAMPLKMVSSAVLMPGVLPSSDMLLPEDGTKYELKLHHLHSGESIDVVYRIGDTYVPAAMDKLDYFLRDSRTQDEKDYDPREFDLLHNLMARLGRSDGVIDVVCGYRTSWTNEFLRTRSRHTGVARNSQHVQAKAIDIRVPGVRTRMLRDVALSLDEGGVGYYPRSQFVHVDVGPVRRWSFFGRGED